MFELIGLIRGYGVDSIAYDLGLGNYVLIDSYLKVISPGDYNSCQVFYTSLDRAMELRCFH